MGRDVGPGTIVVVEVAIGLRVVDLSIIASVAVVLLILLVVEVVRVLEALFKMSATVISVSSLVVSWS